MTSIPYPEFDEFKMKLSKKVLLDSEPVEGYAHIIMNELPNCVKDILISFRCCFRYRTEDGTTHTVLLYEEIQRNSTPFDESGLPPGEYEFPFSFSCPDDLPPSLTVGHETTSVFSCKVWYEIRSYVMHTEGHSTLDRKHLRTAVRFQRYYSSEKNVTQYIMSTDKHEPLNYAFGHVKVQVQLDRQLFWVGEPVSFTLCICHDMLRTIYSVKCYLKQVLSVKKRAMRQVKEYNSISVVAFKELNEKGIPVKRKQNFSCSVSIDARPTSEQTSCMAVGGGQDKATSPALSGTFERVTTEGVSVSYLLEIHLSMVLSADLVVSVPYVTAVRPSDTDESSKPPSYWNQRVKEESAAPGCTKETKMVPSDDKLPSYFELARDIENVACPPVEEEMSLSARNSGILVEKSHSTHISTDAVMSKSTFTSMSTASSNRVNTSMYDVLAFSADGSSSIQADTADVRETDRRHTEHTPKPSIRTDAHPAIARTGAYQHKYNDDDATQQSLSMPQSTELVDMAMKECLHGHDEVDASAEFYINPYADTNTTSRSRARSMYGFGKSHEVRRIRRLSSCNSFSRSSVPMQPALDTTPAGMNVHHIEVDETTEVERMASTPPPRLRGPSLAELSDTFRRQSLAEINSSISQSNEKRNVAIVEEELSTDLVEEEM
eukprot:CFRG4285T1